MRTAVIAAAVILLVPLVEATPEGATLEKETDTIAHTHDGRDDLSVTIDLQFVVSDAARYNGNATWQFFTPTGSTAPTVKVLRNSASTDVPTNRINATGGAPTGFQGYTVSLNGFHSNVQNSERFDLVVSFVLPGLSYRHRFASAVPQAIIWAHPAEGYRPVAVGAPAFQPADERYHSIIANAAPGMEITVGFEATGAGRPARAMDSYVWAVGGLVLGFVLAAFAANRGWLGAQQAKKFKKGGAMESKDMLDARRRTLMAALKELEVAHEAKEIPDAAYAPLKEEYKAQAVRVLRSLEDKKEPPTR